MFDAAFLTSFLQVIMIDLVLAGDNAIVIGLAAAGLPPDLRRKAILIGIVAATLMRIGFALIATQLLTSPACCSPAACCCSGSAGRCTRSCASAHRPTRRRRWRRWRTPTSTPTARVAAGAPRKTLRQAVTQIIIADVSMSLDNVLAVAGAAHEHPRC